MTTPAPELPTPAPETEPAPKPAQNKRALWIMAGAAVAVLFVIAIIVDNDRPDMPVTPATGSTPLAPGIYDEGVLLVPGEVRPGTYRSTVPAGSFNCYWARLRGTSGSIYDIIANDNGDADQRLTVTIESTDRAFETTGCGDWVKIG